MINEIVWESATHWKMNVYVGALISAALATGYCAGGVGSYLGRQIYPMQDDKINKTEYKDLSLIRKLASAVLLLAAGGAVGAFTGTAITAPVVWVLRPINPTLSTLVGTVGCAIIGAITASNATS